MCAVMALFEPGMSKNESINCSLSRNYSAATGCFLLF